MQDREHRKRAGMVARAQMMLGVLTGLAGFAVGWATSVKHLGWTMGLLVGWWPAMIVGAGLAWLVGIGLPWAAGSMVRPRIKPVAAAVGAPPDL